MPLADIATINPPAPTGVRTDPSRRVSFVPMAAVSEEGELVDPEVRTTAEVSTSHTYFERGDILLAKITPCFENGKAALLDRLPHRVGFGSTEFHVIRPGSEVEPGYLFHHLRSPAFRAAGANAMTGSAGQRRVPSAFLLRHRVPLPPLDEQRRIAAVLDKVDTIRRRRREALALLDGFLPSAFLEMFGEPVRNPKGWATARLGDVAEVVSGITKGRKLIGTEATPVPYLRVANVQDGRLDLKDVKTILATTDDVARWRLVAGDVLLTEGGDPDKLGRGGVWRGEIDPCIHQNHIFRVRSRTDRLLPEYLSALLGSAYGKRYFLKAAKQTTGIASINRTQLKDFGVLLAPRELQRQYAGLVSRTDALKRHLDEASQQATVLSESLSRHAFESAGTK